MKLQVLSGEFAVCRLPPEATVDIPQTSVFCSVTRTHDELSVVCEESVVPEGATVESGWRCLRVAGTLPFETIGVLASLTAPLSEAGVSVFAVSTFDTDFLMWKSDHTEALTSALEAHGFEFL